MKRALPFGLTLFAGAFLLFQVQPIIGKVILPWYGGTAAVWTTCMLFFQAVLLLGYLYAHGLETWARAGGAADRGPRRGPGGLSLPTLVHLSLLALSLLFLPITPGAEARPTGSEAPTLGILRLLATTIGLPYFTLATTSPLVQAWFARGLASHGRALGPRALAASSPYRLFAVSNLGSLLGLIAYPLVVERLWSTSIQSLVWSGLYVLYVGAIGYLAWSVPAPSDAGSAASSTTANAPPPGVRRHLGWVALATCPSILLLALTSHLTENIAPMPLLWVAPLAAYLGSFILCFDHPRGYRRGLFLPLMPLALGTLGVLPSLNVSALPLLVSLPLHLAGFFVLCVVCHGELSRLRPDASALTAYYLTIAVGGVMGGLFVGLFAPAFFNSTYEYSIGLVLTALVTSVVVIRHHGFRAPDTRRYAMLGSSLFVVVLLAVRVVDHGNKGAAAVISVRDFYGPLRVLEGGTGDASFRTLMHGQIIHGRQYTHPDWQDWPIAYYAWEGGLGRTMLAQSGRGPLHVGVAGLGAGTIVSYGRSGDTYRLYELAPLVVTLARQVFTFLERTPAHVEVVLGDARLSMEREASQGFDVLVLDAFSGDAVPLHLLTLEAFDTWFRHLKPGGVLVVDVTNRFLDLAPVVAAAARFHGRPARLVQIARDLERQVFGSAWVLVTANSDLFNDEHLRDVVTEIAVPDDLRPWRDDDSSMLSALK